MGVEVVARYTHPGGEEIVLAVECEEASVSALDQVAAQAVRRCAELVGLIFTGSEDGQE